MNLGTETKPESFSEESVEDSFDELINSHRRQRYKVQNQPKKITKIKIFVRLEKHKEIFNYMPDKTTKVDDLVTYFLEKNPKKLQEIYPKSDLKVLLANVHGKKKDFPGEAMTGVVNCSTGHAFTNLDGKPRELPDHNKGRVLDPNFLQRRLDV